MSYFIKRVVESSEKRNLKMFLSKLESSDNRYLLRNEILQLFKEFCEDNAEQIDIKQEKSTLFNLIQHTQEIILEQESLCIIVRPKIAQGEVYRIFYDTLNYEKITVSELLDIRDNFVNQCNRDDGNIFEIDFNSFYDYAPNIKDPKNVGKGVQFLSRFLSGKIFIYPRQWLE